MRIPWLTCLMSLCVCFAAGYGTHLVVEEVLPPLPPWGKMALFVVVAYVVGSILWNALWRAIRSQME